MPGNKLDAEKVLKRIREKDFDRDYDCTPFECGVFSLLDEAASIIEISLMENQRLIDLGRKYKAIAEKAEKQRDAAIKELDDVAAAVDDFSDFIDEQIHPLVQYDIYTALRENADAISMWQYESEWRGQKEE